MKLVDIELVADAVQHYYAGSYGGLDKLTPSVATGLIEASVHELAHAAVFGFKKPWTLRRCPNAVDDGSTIADHVAKRFDAYADKHRSDVSELRAVAVEILVMAMLEIPLHTDKLIASAYRGLESGMTKRDAMRMVRKALREKIAFRRARTVVRWIGIAVKLYRTTAEWKKAYGGVA